MNFGPRRTNQDVFAEHLALAGARILDVGCGTGRMARLLTRMGGKVTGLEPGEVQLERARMVEPEGVETYHE
ncbi:MAG: class I SAM-dependent methyltransferase, partial [Rhodospirillales bacterium]|nr:class I SAM-dependent methyltransferase [Rhodospirillales bacterium]